MLFSRKLIYIIASGILCIAGAIYSAVNYDEFFPNGSTIKQSKDNGWTTPVASVSNTKEIMVIENGVSTCKRITSTTDTQMFIPTRTEAEWASFRDNRPSTITIGECAKNCTYTTYQGTDCSKTCGGGNYATYYTITTPASGGGSCPVTEGQLIAYNGAACNTQACESKGCQVGGGSFINGQSWASYVWNSSSSSYGGIYSPSSYPNDQSSSTLHCGATAWGITIPEGGYQEVTDTTGTRTGGFRMTCNGSTPTTFGTVSVSNVTCIDTPYTCTWKPALNCSTSCGSYGISNATIGSIGSWGGSQCTNSSGQCVTCMSNSDIGKCGTANNTPRSSYPTTASEFCTTGTKVDRDTAGSDGVYNWDCQGNYLSFTSDDVSCSATKTSAGGVNVQDSIGRHCDIGGSFGWWDIRSPIKRNTPYLFGRSGYTGIPAWGTCDNGDGSTVPCLLDDTTNNLDSPLCVSGKAPIQAGDGGISCPVGSTQYGGGCYFPNTNPNKPSSCNGANPSDECCFFICK